MKTTMNFVFLFFLPLLINAKPKRVTLHIPLVHNGANFYDSKVVSLPLSSPHSQRGLAFMAEIHFGSPQKKQFLHMDTGSSLTWTQCFPCSDCYAQKIYPKYRPAASITYRDAMCEDSHPKSNPHFAFDPLTRICTYQQHYLDETNIKGTLAQEMITVDTHDGGFKRVHGVYFGCNTLSDGSYFTGTGILGLGVGKYSIIGEFGSKFSFCLGEISEPKASHNLILGDGANVQGHPTVINITEGHTIFQLESIIVGEEITLDDPVQVFVDTGSTLSHLSTNLYYKFVDAFDDLIGSRPLSYEPTLCYKADTIERLEKMDVGFKFDVGAELSVNIHNIFIQQGPPEIRCLAIQNNKESFSHVIIGVIAMQGYNVGYDLSAKTAYINKQDCDM
ncbi:putative protein [Arabidopsis thaliana]|uniref:Aspartyl protease UND n=1 Tax=Arabidopsis thaliana TaxID=3702 RepID=UND_ARATH|nr:Eukaryotic aspartyl protease family protein [Arabidopsis thaliana]Q9SV77.1 RecName: Full=Aspartyl protease UND; AltName: Full=Protein UNDEAD; Flags: Precursor [Arabidopsis thaliana]AEE83203.1 Eukaryotic aspartyl protease family protein [Arabidopsis thaliana]CAB45491.1 putative protein [Arabidopsis thaliana]CAB78334.1 putative protein [Arabidopsis thaliana]|eukprot:NP_193028.1 Eukaryotic aspartyl protease family protein [Arabidopsis thaliana]